MNIPVQMCCPQTCHCSFSFQSTLSDFNTSYMAIPLSSKRQACIPTIAWVLMVPWAHLAIQQGLLYCKMPPHPNMQSSHCTVPIVDRQVEMSHFLARELLAKCLARLHLSAHDRRGEGGPSCYRALLAIL